MQRFEWTKVGLESKLSENLIPGHPPKMKPERENDDKEPLTSINATNKVQITKSVVKHDNSSPSVWKTVHALASDLRTKVGRALSYLCIQISNSMLDFDNDGGLILKGSHIPGTNIVNILVSAITSANDFEIGEMLILPLLQHCPKSIVRLIQKTKLSFIKEEEHEDGFKPLLQKRELAKSVDKMTVATKRTHFNPEMTATYVPKTAKVSNLTDVKDSNIPQSDMATRKWFDLS